MDWKRKLNNFNENSNNKMRYIETYTNQVPNPTSLNDN